ncbi:hypothetical protein [Lihuaxuella thermophila]|uniref:Uncharacterized protein n=1 Tax=Lihuaxuella thermophila TaxID=1173111 RepID=A0A1H8IT46_9BACL|nr:hypothetical protein [Lihuaxuella thermophila]SEN71714.1 hypothetical protein SAMN05444955_11946 [Lihuaxuella thermophila]
MQLQRRSLIPYRSQENDTGGEYIGQQVAVLLFFKVNLELIFMQNPIVSYHAPSQRPCVLEVFE